MLPASTLSQAKANAYASAAASCSPTPVACGSRRRCRSPSQMSAAPSSANRQAVTLAENASGTARVAKPTASVAFATPIARQRGLGSISHDSSA